MSQLCLNFWGFESASVYIYACPIRECITFCLRQDLHKRLCVWVSCFNISVLKTKKVGGGRLREEEKEEHV